MDSLISNLIKEYHEQYHNITRELGKNLKLDINNMLHIEKYQPEFICTEVSFFFDSKVLIEITIETTVEITTELQQKMTDLIYQYVTPYDCLLNFKKRSEK